MPYRKEILMLNGEIPLNVCFDYTPAEITTQEYPGCTAQAEITEITLKGHTTDLKDYFTEIVIDDLEEECLCAVDGWDKN